MDTLTVGLVQQRWTGERASMVAATAAGDQRRLAGRGRECFCAQGRAWPATARDPPRRRRQTWHRHADYRHAAF